jgi:hypothetical protein
MAQEEEKPKADRPARDAFESAWWFDGQTGKLYDKGTLEMIIAHRFGNINNGVSDLYGIYAPTNIRLGFLYAPIDKLNIGFGYTKNKLILDFFAKYAILTQTRSNSIPISLTYFVNMGNEMNENEFVNTSDRMSYHHALFFTRRFSNKLSVQLSPSFSHYNSVTGEFPEPYVETDSAAFMNHDTWGMSVGIRYKISSSSILMFGYDHPITQHDINQPKPSFSFGLEINTSNHTFQFFFTNNNRIQPQENFTFNQNDWTSSEYLIGFNITRLWSF